MRTRAALLIPCILDSSAAKSACVIRKTQARTCHSEFDGAAWKHLSSDGPWAGVEQRNQKVKPTITFIRYATH